MSTLLTFKSSRSPTQNALIGFFFMLVFFFVSGLIPTQWFASKYGYASNLGEPLFNIGHISIYLPSDWIWWGLKLSDIPALRDNTHIMLLLGLFGLVISFILGILFVYWFTKNSGGMVGLHGTAHWAEKNDVNNTGFISGKKYKPTGVTVGSIMLDSRKRVIHPHHRKFHDRYEYQTQRGRGLKYFHKEILRDSEGRPKFKIKKSVVNNVEWLRDGANTHLFAFCPTRSGKGVSLVLPTLLTQPNSVMVNDPKGEAFALTGGFRKAAGQEVIKFEPACTDGTGARWNPLDEIRIFTLYDVQDAQMIMSMACDPKGEGLEDYFDKAGYEFLMGLALHMRYAETNGSLEGVAKFLGNPLWDSDKQMYLHMAQAIHDPEGKMGWTDTEGAPTKTHPIIANVAKTMLNKEDKDRSGVLSTAKSLLSLYLDPIVARNTTNSDFLVRDIMTHSKPVSLYFVVGPGDMERMVPLTRLFYALFIRRNASDMEFADGAFKKNYTFPLLMILDEMTSLRKLPIIQEALGYVAGYGIRMFMLAQDITQVEDIYGEKQTIDSGASTRIVFAPNKIETAEKLARMTGKTTITEEKSSHSRDLIGIKAGSVSTNTEKIGRDLMTTDEFMSMHDQDVVVFVKGQSPIYGRKSFFYENEVLVQRSKIPPPIKSAVLRYIEAGPTASSMDIINSTSTVNEQVMIKQELSREVHEEWSSSREALRSHVARLLNDDEDETEYTDSQAVKPASGRPATTQKQSKYANSIVMLTEDERRDIEAKASEICMFDRVASLSAFE